MTRVTSTFPDLRLRTPASIERKPFFNLPTSAAQHTLFELLGAGADLDAQQTLIGRKKQLDRHTEIELYNQGNKRQIRYKSRSDELTLQLDDINVLTRGNDVAKDFFLVLLTKLPEQALFNGELCRDSIILSTRELVELGLYTRTEDAKRAFRQAAGILTSIKLKGKFKVKGHKDGGIYTDEVNGLRVLFTGSDDSKRGQCIIHLNSKVNWGAFARFFAPYPKWGFALPSRKARDLLYYIFYMARIKKNEVAEHGYFNIRYRALQATLHLPSEDGNGNTFRTIKEPLEKAISEIEEENTKTDNDLQLTLTPFPSLEASSRIPIKEFLDKGYLRVEISGDYAKAYEELSERQAKKIKQTAKRKERITEKAQVQALASTIKKEASKNGNIA